MSSHFFRQHHSSDNPSKAGRAGEPPRPAGFIKLLSDRDDHGRWPRPEASPPQALSQADGSP